MGDAITIVRDWHTALNNGNVEQLMALVQTDVVVGGPRGKTMGAEVVQAWFGRANVRLLPLRWFHRENTIVVQEQGQWFEPESGEVTSSQIVATVFVTRAGLVSAIMRYDDLETALKEANLSETDEINLS